MEAHARYTPLAPGLEILTGFAGELLTDIDVPFEPYIDAIVNQHLTAIPDRAHALHHLSPVIQAITRRKSVGSLLANRIYPPVTTQELEALTQ